MFPINGHAFPALLPILHVLHDVVAPEVLHALALAGDAVVDDHQGRVVAKVKILSMPSSRKVTMRSVFVACE